MSVSGRPTTGSACSPPSRSWWGGPYAYADDAFGRFAGFLAAWTYWIQGWTGHASIAVAAAATPRAARAALLSTFVYVFGYVLSVAAELCHSLARRTPRRPAGGTLAIAAIAFAMVFSVWMAGAAGAEAVQRGTVLILIGIPVYVVTRRTNPSGRSGSLC